MGSRSMIGTQQADGTIHYIYCHLGAAPGINGHILREHYATPERVRALVDLGSIRTLGPRLAPHPGESHSYDTPSPDVTVAYHRDRGEELPEPTTTTDRDALAGEEWAYLYLEQTQHWEMRRGDGDASWERLDTPTDQDLDDPILAKLQADLAALTKGFERPSPRRERRERREPRRESIEVALHADHADSVAQELENLHIQFMRSEADGRATFRVVAEGTRDEQKTRQMGVTLAAARVASSGARVDVRGPSLPREVQLLNDQVVSPGTETIDYSTHRTLLRRIEDLYPAESHPLVPRTVARARQRDSASSTVDAPSSGPSVGDVQFGPRRDRTELDMKLNFSYSGSTPVRVEHVVRNAEGVALGWDCVDKVLDGSSRFQSRIRTRVDLPLLLDSATSEIRVRTWTVTSTVASPEQDVEEHLVLGSQEAVENNGITLLEWGLARSPYNEHVHLEGLARFSTTSAGTFAVSARRSSSGTMTREDVVFMGWLEAGEIATAELNVRRVTPLDTVSVEVRRLVPGEEHSLRVQHKR